MSRRNPFILQQTKEKICEIAIKVGTSASFFVVPLEGHFERRLLLISVEYTNNKHTVVIPGSCRLKRHAVGRFCVVLSDDL